MSRLPAREIARDFLYLAAARSTSLVISLARSLVIPRYLGPSLYGMWKTLGIVQSYAQFADLGALAALRREVPFFAKRNEQQRLAEARDVAFGVNHAAIFLAAAGVLGASYLVPEPAYARALRLFIPLLYANHIHTFLEQYLYARKEFAYASKVNLALAAIEAALAITGTIFWGLDGLILGTLIGYALAALAQLSRIRFQIGWAFRWRAYTDLVRVGFPSHVNGLLYNLLLSVDRVLILPVLGLEALGLYGLGMTVNEYLFQFSYALGSVISPRLVERWSESESMESLRPMVEKPTLAISAAVPALLGTVYFASGAMVEVVLPQFRDALAPLRILLVGTYFTSLHRGLSSFFLAIRRQGRLLPAYGGAIVLNALLVSAALGMGLGIAGVAAATALSLAVFSFTLIAMAMRFFTGPAGILRFLGKLCIPPLWAAVAVAAGEAAGRALGGSARPIVSAAAGLALFLAAYAPILLAEWRRHRAGYSASAPVAGTTGRTPGT
jgi:O-antigen/teichoic acid export membrane protein